MTLNLVRVDYEHLNARQKENYNFLKVSAILADYGFMTLRLSDDWQGADFIAQNIDGSFLKIQLKGRLTFCEKYRGKDLYVVFPNDGGWYLYPHDELLQRVLTETGIAKTESWSEHGSYSFPNISHQILQMIEPYRLGQQSKQALANVAAE